MRQSPLQLASAITMLAVCTQLVAAQSRPPVLPTGRYDYAVRGFYEGDEMPPWESEIRVLDTLAAGTATRRVVYASRKDGSDYLYSYTSEWSTDGRLVRAHWKNGGRSPGACTLKVSGARLGGQLDDGTQLDAPLPSGFVVPDFAVGAWFASRSSTAGDTVRFTVVRCTPGNTTPIETIAAVGVVSESSEAVGATGAAVPVWLVRGTTNYAFVAVISKRDGVLTRTVTPQGSVGSSEDRLISSRRASFQSGQVHRALRQLSWHARLLVTPQEIP